MLRGAIAAICHIGRKNGRTYRRTDKVIGRCRSAPEQPSYVFDRYREKLKGARRSGIIRSALTGASGGITFVIMYAGRFIISSKHIVIMQYNKIPL